MKPLAHLVLFAGAVLLGFYLRDAFDPPPTDPLELEIALNHERCDKETPAGFAAYPITYFGELRACAVVKLDSPAWATNNIFVRKVKP